LTELRWNDRVYGDSSITDPDLLNLIHCPTFLRLRGIRQAGPSAIAFPFKTVTRYEHSLGVHVLLRRLGADRREQVAGLLHDISHTAFSHAVDFVISSEEQDHHEQLKPILLNRSDVTAALAEIGFRPADFYDDSIYPLLERPLPGLCADRLDYFMRDGLACGGVDRRDVERFLGALEVVDSTIVLTDLAVARDMVARFAAMNQEWWAGPVEAFIYNEFADILREGLRAEIITEGDLLTEDDAVLAKLDASDNELIASKLAAIRHFQPEQVEGYQPKIIPKTRWLDPPVLLGGSVHRLSDWAHMRDRGAPDRPLTGP
jgi:HD superfamily phosphohydrolase